MNCNTNWNDGCWQCYSRYWRCSDETIDESLQPANVNCLCDADADDDDDNDVITGEHTVSKSDAVEAAWKLRSYLEFNEDIPDTVFMERFEIE